MRLFFVTTLLRFFAWMPMGFNRCLGTLIGSLLYALNIRERRTTERNLELCYPQMPEGERKALSRKSLQETSKWAFETSAVWFRNKQWRQSRVKKMTNMALFEQAIASDQGTLLMMPHYGNWEFAGIYVGDLAKGTCIYRTPKMEELDPLVRKAREASELSTLVPATARGVMAVFKALKRGELTVILPDQVPAADSGGVYADFFGISAYTQTLVHNLIQKTNPRVLQLYARRVPGGFELGFMEPHEDIYSEDAVISAAGMNKTIEQLCALDLTQYQWDYKRFKNQPDGEDLYH